MGRLWYINPCTSTTIGVWDGPYWSSGTFLRAEMVLLSYNVSRSLGYGAFIEWQ